jgi:hypothetical protein
MHPDSRPHDTPQDTAGEALRGQGGQAVDYLVSSPFLYCSMHIMLELLSQMLLVFYYRIGYDRKGYDRMGYDRIG